MTDRENYLKTVTFQGPEWIPCNVGISGASWDQFRGEMEDVLVRHPTLFPGFEKGKRDFDRVDYGPAHRSREKFTDNWGCVWESAINGIEGQVLKCPLEDWESLKTYAPPDPMIQGDRGPMDWEASAKNVREALEAGHLTWGGVSHGFLFMRLYYLRGFENLMLDFAAEDPRLNDLITLITDHTMRIVQKWLSLGVEMMSLADDLGTQTASMVSPKCFAKWITPAYARLIQPCREAGVHVFLHSDGYIMGLVDELLMAGVTILNPQDLCNGIDDLARCVKGRACICLDIDRQKIVPFGTRKEIRDLIEEEVRKLGSPAGGLSMIAGIYPPTPPENVDALCCALEEFRTFWSDGRGR